MAVLLTLAPSFLHFFLLFQPVAAVKGLVAISAALTQ